MKRKFRILHIGNIANNAYVNAKLLTQAGHVNHVACYDFYHFAACSEWQNIGVDVSSSFIADANFPNFYLLGDRKPAVPRWFAQGPKLRVLAYLEALNLNDSSLAEWAWGCLRYAHLKVIIQNDANADSRVWSEAQFKESISGLTFSAPDWTALALGRSAESIASRVKLAMLKIAEKEAVDRVALPIDRTWLEGLAGWDTDVRYVLDNATSDFLEAIGVQSPNLPEYMPDRLDESEMVQASAYFHALSRWKRLMSYYDVVVGYGPDPLLPFLTNCPCYVAYEHGTLRDIPFGDDALGMLVRKSYEAADFVFITNTDYFTQERQLAIAQDRICGIPHAFDERPVREHVASLSLRREKRTTFFGPARQDWVNPQSTLTKYNNFVVYAVANLVRLGYSNFVVIFVSWGDDVIATKSLIDQLGVGDYFEWTEPLAKRRLWETYAKSHAVIDQFLHPSLSGVSFEALSLGCRVITRDNGSNAKAFGDAPPLLSADDVPSTTIQMRRVLDDPDDLAGIGLASAEWIDRYHSAHRIVAIQEECYTQILDRSLI